LQCGTVQGGIAANTVPKECSFSVEVRYLPSGQPDSLIDEIQWFINQEIIPQMQRNCPLAGVDLQLVNDTPGFEISPESPLVRLVQQLTGAHLRKKVAYNTEAGLFQASGLPTVICGPGSIEQAHRPNEFIALSQLGACEHFLSRLLSAEQDWT
jgi:acetylornithine deacetylase